MENSFYKCLIGWSKHYGAFYLYLQINRTAWHLSVRLNSDLSQFLSPQISRACTHIVLKRCRLKVANWTKMTDKGKLHEIPISVLLGDWEYIYCILSRRSSRVCLLYAKSHLSSLAFFRKPFICYLTFKILLLRECEFWKDNYCARTIMHCLIAFCPASKARVSSSSRIMLPRGFCENYKLSSCSVCCYLLRLR